MTDFSVNGKTLSDVQIFNILDNNDNSVSVIKKDTWNIFAEKAKGNQIKNFIKKENAIAAIGRYLDKADDAVMKEVFDFVFSLEQKNKNNEAKIETQAVGIKTNSQVKVKSAVKPETPVVKQAEVKNNTKVEHKHYQPKMTKENVKATYPEILSMVEKNMSKYKNYSADSAYWTELIGDACKKYGVEPEAIVSIIGREVRWKENVTRNVQSGGPMQVTQSTIKDFWPGTIRNENYWAKVDKDLLNEILYDENGKLRYETPKELWNACINDHEFGIKVGILVYKGKELKSLARMEKRNQLDIVNDVDTIKSNMTEDQRNSLQRRIFAAYNGGGTEGYESDTFASYLQCKRILNSI